MTAGFGDSKIDWFVNKSSSNMVIPPPVHENAPLGDLPDTQVNFPSFSANTLITVTE